MKTQIVATAGAFLAATTGLFLNTAPELGEQIGWVLIHSIWQLGLISLVYATVAQTLHRRSANARYAASVAAMCLMVVVPCWTWTSLESTPLAANSDSVSAVLKHSEDENVVATHTGAMRLGEGIAPDSPPQGNLETPLHAEFNASVSAQQIATPHPEVEAARLEAPTNPSSKPSRVHSALRAIGAAVEPRLPMMAGLWLIGVLASSLRPILGLWIQWRLRRTGLSPVAQEIQTVAASVARRIGLRRAVRTAQSSLVKVPVVVGYFRPIILLPATVLTGLTPDQLEAVLAHEMAHIRRHDWLVNALQVVIETVLFYHPAVWWISRRVRRERELCCDDIALSISVDRAVYARTLLTLEELRQHSITPALAATGGDLASRVRRLMSPTPAKPRSGGGAVAVLLVVGFSLALFVTSSAGEPQQGENGQPEATATADDATPQESTGSAPVRTANDKQPVSTKGRESVRRRSVRVLDESEHPIEGAEVRFQFSHSEPGLHSINTVMTEKTDANGVAAVEAPPQAEEVLVTVKADGFGEFNNQQQPTGDSVIRLKRGRVIHVRAVSESGDLLRKAVPLLEQSRIYGREFTALDDGTFQSPAVDKNRRLMRVVSAQQNGPMLFSDLVDVSVAKPDREGILQLTLRPGAKLTGKLDDSVPRPISEGYVRLMVVEDAGHRLKTTHNQFRNMAWAWSDSVPVQADGTFSFESVPSGGIAQIHVVVDGYMSVNPPLESLAAIIQSHGGGDESTLASLKKREASRAMWPHFVPMNQPAVNVTVQCGPTASCDFRILDPAGKPIPGADVSFCPNGIFINGRLFVPGYNSFQNSNLVRGLFHGRLFVGQSARNEDDPPYAKVMKKESAWGRRSFIGVKTDANGIAKIRNLPGGTREGFTVTADGLVLPYSPLYPDFDERREGYVDLVAGETVEATIYLERDLPTIDREILLVDEEGTPLENATIALTDLRVGSKDWQRWSTQRFGALPTAKTDRNGRVVLNTPSQVGDVAVDRIRLAVNYRDDAASESDRDKRLWINGRLVEVPLKADGGVISVARNPDSSRISEVVYGSLQDVLGQIDSKQLLKAMIRRPGVPLLRQLLASANGPEPIFLLDEGRFGGQRKGVRVRLLSTGKEQLALVAAKVRPVDGTRAGETVMSRLPECVFVFDSEGRHLATLGGKIGTTGAGSPDRIEILNLGPVEDWFVRVTRSQANGPFDYQSTYYRIASPNRIASPMVESLRYFHYPNSNSWSNGPERVLRYGSLNFELLDNKSRYAGETVGLSPEGVPMNGKITWDADKNRFFGAEMQTVNNRPLFRVDTSWSKEFETLAPKVDQMILLGGVGAYDHWYRWDAVVPEGYEAVVSVTIPQRGKQENAPAKIVRQTLKAGRHMIQFQAKPTDDGSMAKLKLGYGKDQKIQTAATLSFSLDDPPAIHPPIVNTLNPNETVRLVTRTLKDCPEGLTLDVQLERFTNE